jgi:phosphatidylglycerophosphate synthase
MSTSTVGTESEIACSYAMTIEPATPIESSRVFGLDPLERLRRSFSRIGLRIVDASELEHIDGERIIALRESHFYDDRLITALVEDSRDVLLLADETDDACVSVGMVGPVSKLEAMLPRLRDGNCSREEADAMGIKSVYPIDVVPAYDPKLRKHVPPFVLPADADRTREVQVRIFDAAYKGTTDFVTKWVWPRPARIVTGWCARLGIAPNTVTAVSYLLTLFSLFAFWQGNFAEGLVSAWLMTFLDTVDGKLARVTLTSSKLGDVLDHSLDIIHPPFWWAAWGAGLAGPGMLFGDFGIWVAIIFIGYIVGRLLEGLFILAFGQEMFTWRPFDIGFRLIIARRNPNLVLLTGSMVLGRPDLGLIAIGIWTLSCIFIQIIRIAQAAAFQLRGHKISPYTG